MAKLAPRGRPTLEQVAARAGVSRATVSRVVNGHPAVAPSLREAVERAVDELGYIPNPAARSLVTQRTGSFALVVSEPPDRVFSDDPYFAGIAQGVSQGLDAAGRQLLLMLAGQHGGPERIWRYVSGGHVDGVVLVSAHGADPLPGMLARLGVPVVCGGRQLAAADVPYVDVDNVAGARTAVQHLVDLGRRRIATVAGPQDMVAGIDRLAGYRQALAGTDVRSIVAMGDFTRESGEQSMRQVLTDDPALDAVFVASDMMAEGALRALHQAGRRVPDDVAVVGFDNKSSSASTDPPLTTIHHPIVDMGREMARMLLSLSAGEPVDSPVLLPTPLVRRESA